jgi:hypothetical protein
MTFLLETMRAHGDREAIASNSAVTTYQGLLTYVAAWQDLSNTPASARAP